MLKKPIVMLVGHGKVSGQKTVIEPEKHTIIFLGQVGEALCLTAHNLIVQNFVDADVENKLFEELERLIRLPSISIVNFQNKRLLSLPPQIQYEEINLLKLELEKFKTEATSSQKSWIIYEHKIAPALELLNSASTLRPMNIGYSGLNLIYSTQRTDNTLEIWINKQKLETQINDLLQASNKINTSIFDNNFIYITPMAEYNQQVTFDLSKILKAIFKVNILAVFEFIS